MTVSSVRPTAGLVSVVTAVRNGEKAIGITLDSVARQTYSDVEHVIIDGASSDGTMDIVRSRNTRLGEVVSEPDSGVFNAFNKGLRRAKGEWIIYLGAGDRFATDDAIAKLMAATRKANVEMVFADLVIVDPVDDRVIRTFGTSNFSPERIRSGYMPAHPALLVNRAIYDEFGEYDESYRIAGDFDFVARVFAEREIRYDRVPEGLVKMQSGGVSNSGWKSKWRITQEMHRSCAQHGHPTSWLRLLIRLPVKYVGEVLLWKRKP